MASQRKRLLFISPVVPSRCGNGLAMRAGFLLDSYAQNFEIDLVIVPVATPAAAITEFCRTRARRTMLIEELQADSHFGLVRALKDPRERLLAFSAYGRPSLTAFLTSDVQRRVAEWSSHQHYAAIHMSRLYLAPLAETWAREPGSMRLILDCDENDARTYRRIAPLYRLHGRHAEAAWAEAEAAAFERLAAQWLPKFDTVLASSRDEATSLTQWLEAHRVACIPNVISGKKGTPMSRNRKRDRVVMFVGTMGYVPNVDAMLWFTSRIWPRVRHAARCPLRLIIVGRNPPPEIVKLGRQPGILVTGTVPTVSKYYDIADVVVAPIRAGGGTRIKLLEAAAHGVPMVATTLGAMGTGLVSGRHILLADTEVRFAKACITLLRDQATASRLAERAKRLVDQNYRPAAWARRVAQLALAA